MRTAILWLGIGLGLTIANSLQAMQTTSTESQDEIATHCPAFSAWQRAHPRNVAPQDVAADQVTHPELRMQLLAMYSKDQEARKEAHASGEAVMGIDRKNLPFIRNIVDVHGFPSPAMVGKDGVEAAFILVQHANRDVQLQERVLSELNDLHANHKISGQALALLTDRLLVNRGLPQRYGTQFIDRDGFTKPRPIENLAKVDGLRRQMGLPPLSDYACVMSVMSGLPAKIEP